MIRKAERRDAKELEAIARAAYSKYLDIPMPPPDPLLLDYEAVAETGDTFVFENDGVTSGMVTYTIEEDAVILRNLAVLPNLQGGGIGKQLTDFVENEALKRDLNIVRLWTRTQMEDNIRFYTSRGYEITHYNRSGESSRVYFRKVLSGSIPKGILTNKMVKT